MKRVGMTFVGVEIGAGSNQVQSGCDIAKYSILDKDINTD